jgi:hypothetical protein
MDRSIGLERVFSLGDYKSLRITDYSNGIPDELALDEEFVDKLRSLQLVSADKAYYEYSVMNSSMSTFTDREKLEYLTEKETNLYADLVALMSQEDSEEES